MRMDSWYAIRVQSKFEKAASNSLRGKGYQEFLPLYRAKRRWSDRIKEVELPLFPNYLFCRFNTGELLPILTTPGVIGVVSAGKKPIPVPDEEIDAVQAVLRSGLAAFPWPALQVGSRVLLERGPLAGIEGTVINLDKTARLIISVSLLQRAVSVEIERQWVRPIGTRTKRKGTLLQPLEAAW